MKGTGGDWIIWAAAGLCLANPLLMVLMADAPRSDFRLWLGTILMAPVLSAPAIVMLLIARMQRSRSLRLALLIVSLVTVLHFAWLALRGPVAGLLYYPLYQLIVTAPAALLLMLAHHLRNARLKARISS